MRSRDGWMIQAKTTFELLKFLWQSKEWWLIPLVLLLLPLAIALSALARGFPAPPAGYPFESSRSSRETVLEPHPHESPPPREHPA